MTLNSVKTVVGARRAAGPVHKLLLIDWSSLQHHNHVQGLLRSGELVLCVRAQRSECVDWLETTELK